MPQLGGRTPKLTALKTPKRKDCRNRGLSGKGVTSCREILNWEWRSQGEYSSSLRKIEMMLGTGGETGVLLKYHLL